MTRSERRYYVLSGTYNLAQFFIAPVYPLFLLSRGLDLFQINAVLATYGITVFVFEVPTGAIADAVGRRTSFVVGCLVRAAAYALYTLAADFQQCLLAEFLDAVGTTFVSGALDAWMVDGARGEGDDGPLDRVFSRAAVIARALMIGGGLAAGYLGEVSLVVPWLVAAAIFLATAVAGGILMRGAPRPARTASVRRTALDGLAVVRGSPVLVVLSTLSAMVAFAAVPVHMLWQPRLQALGAEHLRVMGWVAALMNGTSLVGSALLPRALRAARRESVLAAATLWRAAMVGVLARATTIGPALAGLLLQEVAFGVSEPVAVAWTNDHVAAAQRATVLSVRSTFVIFGMSIGLLTIGLVARTSGMSTAFGTSAALLAAVAPGFLVLGRVARRAAAAEPADAAASLANVG
jgi:MFS family permease